MSQKAAVQKPSERTWTIPCGFVTEDGGLWVDQPGLLGEGLGELAAIIRRCGGVAQLGAIREELPVAPHTNAAPAVSLVTTSVFVRWQSFSPATTKATEDSAGQPSEAPSS